MTSAVFKGLIAAVTLVGCAARQKPWVCGTSSQLVSRDGLPQDIKTSIKDLGGDRKQMTVTGPCGSNRNATVLTQYAYHTKSVCEEGKSFKLESPADVYAFEATCNEARQFESILTGHCVSKEVK